jgi:hypothetical protein
VQQLHQLTKVQQLHQLTKVQQLHQLTKVKTGITATTTVNERKISFFLNLYH